jgi:3-hydroxyisobutyrate dehydrogenase-like beta-hydroxyacid dehydrogenase
MAANLADFVIAQPGGELLVYNRTASKAAEFAAARLAGVTAAATTSELAARCSVTFCCLVNDSALEAVFSDFLQGPPNAGAVFVDCSTVLPSTTAKLAAQAADRGIAYCTCPIFGRPDAAAAGSLMAALAGATAEVRGRLRPLVAAFAKNKVWDLGDDAAAANAFKLTGNMYIVSQIELAAECLTLGEAVGGGAAACMHDRHGW